MKKTLAIFLVMIIYAQSLNADISSGQYGVAQVFDVQRSPAFPVANNTFTVSSFNQPIGSGGAYTIAADEYIQFNDTDTASATCDYEINLFNTNGFVRQIASGGGIYGLGSKGFLHVSSPNGFGTFVSNQEGFSLGESLSYIPLTAQATCAEIEAYVATTGPLADGEVPSVTVPIVQNNNAQPIPVLGGFGLFMLSGLLGFIGFLQRKK